MTIPQAVILGIVQGITEFFPVSSSGHLVIMQGLFGIKEPQLAFDIFLHLGTLLSIVIYFRKDIVSIVMKDRITALYLITASIPTFAIALMFKDVVEELFARPHIVGYMFLATGIVLLAATFYIRFNRSSAPKRPNFINSLIIGAAQGAAIIPGISRSGATIAAGIFSGIGKEQAVRFSFLLAIPAISGATVFKCAKIGSSLTSANLPNFLAGGITAAATGIFSIGVLLKAVKSDKLYVFGIYCIIAAFVVITLL